MKKAELIIFDCDGTIVDSETLHNQAVSDVLAGLGYSDYTLEYCLDNFAGKGMTNVIAAIESREAKRLPDDFLEQYRKIVLMQLQKNVKPVPYAVEAVKILAQDYKVCVASNGEREHVLQSVESIGLLDVFGKDAIFTKSQVERGKPFPDLFLYAAEKMGVSPERSIVIEDSLTGARAGVAAGMETIGITAVSHHPEQIEKDMKNIGIVNVFNAWQDILTHIKGTVDSLKIASCNNR